MSTYTQNIVCNYKTSTDNVDLYGVAVECTNTTKYSLSIVKKIAITKIANIKFSNSIIKKLFKLLIINFDVSTNIIKSLIIIIATNYNLLVDNTSKVKKSFSNKFYFSINKYTKISKHISIINLFSIGMVRSIFKNMSANFTQFVDTIDLYGVYVNVTTGFTQFIGHVWGQGNWGEFDWGNRYIIKKVFKNVNCGIDITSQLKNKVSKKFINTCKYGVNTTKRLSKLFVIAHTKFIDTMDLFAVYMAIILNNTINSSIVKNTIITKIVNNKFNTTIARVMKRAITIAIEFRIKHIRRIPDFHFNKVLTFSKKLKDRIFYHNKQDKTFYHKKGE